MPELPGQVRDRYSSLGLGQYDVLVLADDADVAAYFDAVLAAGAPPKPAANWVMGDVMAHCKEARIGWGELARRMVPATLAEMISLIEDGTISGKIGKDVLPALLEGEGGSGNGSVRALVEARGLAQISDPAALAAIVDAVLAANPKQLQQFREGGLCTAVTWDRGCCLCFHNPSHALPRKACLLAGKTKLQGFFVGAAMKESKGRANPTQLNRILMERLSSGS
jgi:aspartyl-tRNA(Asn)/glutamyl-tRNA(Gln) amidotransferase subunit B